MPPCKRNQRSDGIQTPRGHIGDAETRMLRRNVGTAALEPATNGIHFRADMSSLKARAAGPSRTFLCVFIFFFCFF